MIYSLFTRFYQFFIKKYSILKYIIADIDYACNMYNLCLCILFKKKNNTDQCSYKYIKEDTYLYIISTGNVCWISFFCIYFICWIFCSVNFTSVIAARSSSWLCSQIGNIIIIWDRCLGIFLYFSNLFSVFKSINYKVPKFFFID